VNARFASRLLLVISMVPSSAHSKAPTFESLEEESVGLATITEWAARAKNDCACLDEFEQRGCREESKSADAELRKKPIVAFDVGPELRVQLAKYDFKTGVFPASLSGGLLGSEDLQGCAAKAPVSDGCAAAEMIGEPEKVIAVVIKDPAWTGQVSVGDEAVAKSLRDDPGAIRGQLLVRVESVALVKRENTTLAAKKKALLSEIDARLKPILARHGKAAVQDVLDTRSCYARASTQDVVLTISTSFAGLRLLTKGVDDYLVSDPASSESLRTQRERERQEELANRQRERDEQVKAEATRRAAVAAQGPIVFVPSRLRITLGGMDADAVNNVITDRYKELASCVTSPTTADAVLELDVYVDKDGSVLAGERWGSKMIRRSTTNRPLVDQCMLRAIGKWKFPPPDADFGVIVMHFSLPAIAN
jgi:hypothetical protein